MNFHFSSTFFSRSVFPLLILSTFTWLYFRAWISNDFVYNARTCNVQLTTGEIRKREELSLRKKSVQFAYVYDVCDVMSTMTINRPAEDIRKGVETGSHPSFLTQNLKVTHAMVPMENQISHMKFPRCCWVSRGIFGCDENVNSERQTGFLTVTQWSSLPGPDRRAEKWNKIIYRLLSSLSCTEIQFKHDDCLRKPEKGYCIWFWPCWGPVWPDFISCRSVFFMHGRGSTNELLPRATRTSDHHDQIAVIVNSSNTNIT